MSRSASVTWSPLGSSGLMLLQITLVLLKAFDVIHWSWFVVFFPMWMGLAFLGSVLAFIALAFVCVFAVGFLHAMWKAWRGSKNRWH